MTRRRSGDPTALWAAMVLDGSDGFYAVAFRRDVEGSGRIHSEYPYALVAWADSQTYTSLPATPNTPGLPSASTRTLHVSFPETLHLQEVPTLPRELTGAETPVSGQPCGPTEGPALNYTSSRYLTFDPPTTPPISDLLVYPSLLKYASLVLQVDEASEPGKAPVLWLMREPVTVHAFEGVFPGRVLFEFSSLEEG